MKKVMTILNKIILFTYDLLVNLGAVVLLVTLVIVTVSVFYRYVLNHSLSWSEELCSYLLIWLAYLAAGTATVAKSHIVADFISNFIKGTPKKILSWIIRLVMIAFFVVITSAIFKMIPKLVMVSSALEIPRRWYYYPIAGMNIYMIFAIIVDLLNDIFPGYNFWRQRQDELDKKEAEEEAALQAESMASVQEFMGDKGGDAS